MPPVAAARAGIQRPARRRLQRIVVHRANDADYLAPVSLRSIVDRDPPADRILARPVLRRGRFVDHRDTRRIAGIAILEEPAGDEPDAHRLEVARRRGPPVGVREVGAARHGAPFDLERPHVLQLAQREFRDTAGGLARPAARTRDRTAACRRPSAAARPHSAPAAATPVTVRR